jgi:DNA polymerase-3 subunit epsilon
MKNYEYVILDIETTGFSPKIGDRIIELGALVVSKEGTVLEEFETLINPHRDLGATWVHKIKSEMLKDAPSFEDISGNLIELLNGRIVVCHNAGFDLRFINHEFRKKFKRHKDLTGICTLELTKEIFPYLPSYKLGLLAEYFDINFSNLHSAFEDAKVTKDLFLLLMENIESKEIELDLKEYILSIPFCSTNILDKKNFAKRLDFNSVKSTSENLLSKMLKRLPNNTRSKNLPIQEYLNILEDALSDRIITEKEASKLFQLAQDYNISKEEVIEIHEEYLRRLIRIYLLDRIISNSEYDDLLKVSKILGLNEKLNLMIDSEKSDIDGLEKPRENQNVIEGKSICFTGQLTSNFRGKRIERTFAQELAMEKGLIIKNGVTKNLDILVVADPHTLSSKAQKAREYGVKIVAEPVFWKMIGLNVE